ncbi:MAG: D-2-hydroxyacid dehydrogenase [Bacteroidales bacterium]|nr:D-2-hydroxyacid dehydrogenase [Bacteroidales bacterium]
MKIVFLDIATMGDDIELMPLQKRGTLISYPLSDAQQARERIKDADVVIVNKQHIGKEEIDAAKNLKLICVSATGVNNINVEYAKSRGIPVMNVVDYSTESVAQITFGSLLTLVNNTIYFDAVVKDGRYSANLHFTDTGRFFHELKGLKFGIIGMGNIGKRVAQIAACFGCEVSYYSTSGIAHCSDYTSLSLEKMISLSDIVSIHSPLNERTVNLITMNELRKMKPTAILINMGRGGIVNESDLADALNLDIIAGAVVDVYQKEPIPSDHPYLNLKRPDKMVLTPHIGWASIEARRTLMERLGENIDSITKQNSL